MDTAALPVASLQRPTSLRRGAAALAARAWRGATRPRTWPVRWPLRWIVAGAAAETALVVWVNWPLLAPVHRAPGALPDVELSVLWELHSLGWVGAGILGSMALVVGAQLLEQRLRTRAKTGTVRATLLGHHAYGPMVVLDAALQAGLSVADGLEAAIRAAHDRRVRAALVEVQARWQADVPLGRALWESGLFPRSQRGLLLSLLRPDQVAAALAGLAGSLRLPPVARVTWGIRIGMVCAIAATVGVLGWCSAPHLR